MTTKPTQHNRHKTHDPRGRDKTYSLQLSEGCGVCPLENDGRCMPAVLSAPKDYPMHGSTARDSLTRVPNTGIRDDCPMKDGGSVRFVADED